MKTRINRAFIAVFLMLFTVAAMPTASPAPTAAPAESSSEQAFVASVTSDLQGRFATTAQASAAGYFRYTGEDQTGAISWVNTSYWQSDETHPSQLWYDAKGHLIGADFSVLQSNSKTSPTLYGVSSTRWLDFSPAHVHFAINSPSGLQFGGVGDKTMTKVGGSVSNPTAADIVKIGKLARWSKLGIPAPKTTADVAFVFEFPAIWDLQVWLVPNPLGAFAEHNPNVTPTAAAKNMD